MGPSRAHRCATLPALRRLIGALCVVLIAAGLLTGCGSSDNRVGVSLILKTQTNPYFVAMKKAAQAEADRLNVRLSVAAGTVDGDTQNQITAIYTAIARGDDGILITTNGDAVNAALRQAKSEGLFVGALDTALTPADTADITFGTDNEEAGRLIGQYAAATLNGGKAIIAMLDLFDDQIVSVDINRDHGFLKGMGIDPGNPNVNGQEARVGTYTGGSGGPYEVVCHLPTQGAIDGGRKAMERCLSINPGINVVYAINEPAGRGAFAALTAAGRADRAAVFTIDGSCQGIVDVRNGVFAADATQYPGKMAALGVKAIAERARGEAPPTATEEEGFFDTGTALVVKDPQPGLASQTPEEALASCWGNQ